MLVLSRKEGERIMIGSDIEVIVTQIRGDRVRLALKAPPQVPIHRHEIHLRLEAERRAEHMQRSNLEVA